MIYHENDFQVNFVFTHLNSVLNEDQNELDLNSTELPPDDVSSECSTVRVSPPVTRSTRVIRESNISKFENIIQSIGIEYVLVFISITVALKKYWRYWNKNH